jgi:VWFA-related protein
MVKLSQQADWSLVLVLLAFPSFLLAGADDSPKAPFRAGTSEVRVTFFATDENNRLVNHVYKDDFAVVDSGIVIRDFRSLTASQETALDVVVLVDTSDSVAPGFQETMREVLQFASKKPLTADDNISVVTFGSLQPVLVCSGDCRSSATLERLLAAKAAGATPLFDALDYAANFISGRNVSGVRRVIILFSDGNDTISKISLHDAVAAVIASGALLYTVDLNQSGSASNGSAVLEHMAGSTGGRSFSSRDGGNALQAALADLHASYVVTYQLPSRAPGLHSLRILPKHNLSLRFHCRSGYYYEETVR